MKNSCLLLELKSFAACGFKRLEIVAKHFVVALQGSLNLEVEVGKGSSGCALPSSFPETWFFNDFPMYTKRESFQHRIRRAYKIRCNDSGSLSSRWILFGLTSKAYASSSLKW